MSLNSLRIPSLPLVATRLSNSSRATISDKTITPAISVCSKKLEHIELISHALGSDGTNSIVWRAHQDLNPEPSARYTVITRKHVL